MHSYKGGTGKTLLSLNLAAMFDQIGKKVCLIDMDFRAPSLCAASGKRSKFWFNDYLCRASNIAEVLTDCTTDAMSRGRLFVGLANPSTEAIREMTAGDKELRIETLCRLISLKRMSVNDLKFDYVFFDTSPGLQYSSINAIVTADFVLLATTADDADMLSTRLMIRDTYNPFEKKTGIIIINKMPSEYFSAASWTGQSIFNGLLGLPTVGVLPCFCDILKAEGKSLYVIENPNHPFTLILQETARTIEELMHHQICGTPDPEESYGKPLLLR